MIKGARKRDMYYQLNSGKWICKKCAAEKGKEHYTACEYFNMRDVYEERKI